MTPRSHRSTLVTSRCWRWSSGRGRQAGGAAVHWHCPSGALVSSRLLLCGEDTRPEGDCWLSGARMLHSYTARGEEGGSPAPRTPGRVGICVCAFHRPVPGGIEAWKSQQEQRQAQPWEDCHAGYAVDRFTTQASPGHQVLGGMRGGQGTACRPRATGGLAGCSFAGKADSSVQPQCGE